MKKKKIAIILFSLHGGGAERNAINIYRMLRKTYIINIVVVKNINEYKQEYKGVQIPIISLLPDKSSIPVLLKPIRAIQLCIHAYRFIKNANYDLFIGGSEYIPFYLAVIFAQLSGKKSLLIVGANVQSMITNQLLIFRFIHYLLFKILFHFTNHIVCVSDGLRKNIQTMFSIRNEKISSIHNGIDTAKIQAQIDTIKANQKYFVTVSRFVKKKGLEQLIKHFAFVVAKHNTFQLHILGRGPLEASLRLLTKRLHLERNIIFMPFQKPYKQMSQSYALVFPSQYEGFGNVIIEAMACGCPIISVDCPYGPAEILDATHRITHTKRTQFGILTPHNNYHELADAMLFLIDHPQVRDFYANASLERVKKFTIQKMTTDYKNLIEILI